MCTAISFKTSNHYFGRNLDLEYCYQEAVTITPRNYPFSFRKAKDLDNHYAMIGIATIVENYPLYYDATNEFGLSIAGLNFPGNAVYHPCNDSSDNITPFELIPWILGQCKTVADAEELLTRINLASIDFNNRLRTTPLHWIISDRKKSITVEPLKDGLKVYENQIGVLTNNPPFDFHMHNLCNYLNLSNSDPESLFAGKIPLILYSRGLGSVGLPGDLSSASRFVRAAYVKLNSVYSDDEDESVCQFFHILSSVEQQSGCVLINGAFEKTVYSSCCNTDKGIYYYRTYENSQITAVNLYSEQLDSNQLSSYPLRRKQQVIREN